MDAQRRILQDVDATAQDDDPIRLGGWVFLGAVRQFYANQQSVPPLLRGPVNGWLPRVALVEAFFYIKVRALLSFCIH